MHGLLHALHIAVAGVVRSVQHHQRLQGRHDLVAHGMPHVTFLPGAQLLAVHVVLHPLQQVGQAARQNAQLV